MIVSALLNAALYVSFIERDYMDTQTLERQPLASRIFGDVHLFPNQDTLIAFLSYVLVLGTLYVAFQVFTTARTAANFITFGPARMTQLLWILVGGLLGFAVTAVAAGRAKLSRSWLIVSYLGLVGTFLVMYLRATQMHVAAVLRGTEDIVQLPPHYGDEQLQVA
jgi:hypothetical protein